MPQALKLLRIDFDTLENHLGQALQVRELAIYVDNPPPTGIPDRTIPHTAYAKVEAYLNTLKVQPYLGWNLQVYPQFKVEEVTLK